MKLNAGKRMTVVATITRKADTKDTINTLKMHNMDYLAELIKLAIDGYNTAKKNCNADKTLGKIGLQDAVEMELNRITDLSVQTLAKMMNNAGSVNDYLFNTIQANTFTMNTNNEMFFISKETIIPTDEFKEQVINPTNSVKIGTVDFMGQNFINFTTEHIRAMVSDNAEIPASIKKAIITLCDKKDLELFEGANQNVEFKESLEKFDNVMSNFESTIDSICVKSETGEFESITKRS